MLSYMHVRISWLHRLSSHDKKKNTKKEKDAHESFTKYTQTLALRPARWAQSQGNESATAVPESTEQETHDQDFTLAWIMDLSATLICYLEVLPQCTSAGTKK